MAREEWGEWPRRPRRRARGAGYGEELGGWWRPPRWEEGASRWGWEPWSREERRRLRERRPGAWEREEPWAPEPEYEERWIPEAGYDYPYAARRPYRPYRERYAYGWPYHGRHHHPGYAGEFAAGYGEAFYGRRRPGWRGAREARGYYGAEYGW